MLMLREINTGKIPAPPATDSSSSWDREDDSPAEEGENEEEEGENAREGKADIRRCRKCNAILRAGNDDTLCFACQRAERDGTAKKFAPRDPNQKF